MQLEHDGRIFRGRGVSTDSIEASPGVSCTAAESDRGGMR